MIPERLQALRAEMQKRGIDIYIVPTADFHESEYVGVITWGLYGAGERCLKEKFIIPVEVEFENNKFYTISCWKEYLTGLYGDYMKLPPEDKRRVHLIKAWID